uniref:Uncharacterized protein n=1 Tax=Anguilla anguilla TaxID=7936 RepID=A0A0E9XFI1_ANGAN
MVVAPPAVGAFNPFGTVVQSVAFSVMSVSELTNGGAVDRSTGRWCVIETPLCCFAL